MSLAVLPPRVHNLSNQPFGDLIAKQFIEIRPGEGAIWECLCVCGEMREVSARFLKNRAVTRCEECAREQRTKQLLHSSAMARSQKVFHHELPEYMLHWEFYFDRMTPAQADIYEELIARRRAVGMPITPLIQAEAVDVAYRECPAIVAA